MYDIGVIRENKNALDNYINALHVFSKNLGIIKFHVQCMCVSVYIYIYIYIYFKNTRGRENF